MLSFNQLNTHENPDHLSILKKDPDGMILLSKFEKALASDIKNSTKQTFIKVAIEELYMRKLRVKKILEILSLGKTAGQLSPPLLMALEQKRGELSSDMQISQGSLESAAHLVNEMLNLFERCYGLPIFDKDLILIRERTLRSEKESICKAIDEILFLWQRYQPLFSLSARKAVTDCFFNGISVRGISFSFPGAILMARIVDNLKKEISQESAREALSSLLPPEATQKTLCYVFAEKGHFENLLDEFNKIYAQKERERATLPDNPADNQPLCVASPVSEKIHPVQNGTHEPHTEISSSLEVKCEVAERTVHKRSFAEIVKTSPPVLEDKEKKMLSLYAQSLDVSPSADLLPRRDGRRISLREPGKPRQSIIAAPLQQPSRLSKTQSMVNLLPVAVVGKKIVNQGQSTLTKAQSTTNLAVVAKTTKKGFVQRSWSRFTSFFSGEETRSNPFADLPLEDIQEQEIVEPESKAIMLAPPTVKKKKNKKKQNKKKETPGSKKDDDEILAQAMRQCTLTTQEETPVKDKKYLHSLLKQAKEFESTLQLQGELGGGYTCRIEEAVSLLEKAKYFYNKMDEAKKEREFQGFRNRVDFVQSMNRFSEHVKFLEKQGIRDFLRHYEKIVLSPKKEYVLVSEDYDSWEKMALLIQQLYDTHKLKSFLAPDVSVQDYCERLIQKLEQLEEKYGVKYQKKGFTDKKTEESLVKEIAERSEIVKILFAMQDVPLLFDMGTQFQLETFRHNLLQGLEKSGWELQISQNDFFQQFKSGQSQNPITPLFQQSMVAASRESFEERDKTYNQPRTKRCL